MPLGEKISRFAGLLVVLSACAGISALIIALTAKLVFWIL